MRDLGLHVLKSPSGRWYFAGRVPIALAMVRKSDNGIPTAEEVALDQRMPGSPKYRRLAMRTFESEAEARAAAALISA